MKSAAIKLTPILLIMIFSLAWTGCKTTPVKEEPLVVEENITEKLPVVESPPVVEERILRYGDEDQPDDIYTSSKGRIYVKSKTPIYLSIATKIEADNGNDVELRNEATRNGKTRPKPFYFEGHGKHSLVHPPAHRHKATNGAALTSFTSL